MVDYQWFLIPYKTQSITILFALSVFLWSRSIYISVTELPEECPSACEIMSLGISSEYAVVPHECLAQYVESSGHSGFMTFLPPRPTRSMLPIFFSSILQNFWKSRWLFHRSAIESNPVLPLYLLIISIASGSTFIL